MYRYLTYLPLILIITLWFIPDLSIAQGPGGFVNCEGAGCRACDLVSMANEIIGWLIGMIGIIFGALMAVAGFGLVTSGGNPSALNAAKAKFTNALIGIVIVLVAWVLVDFIMKKLVSDGTTGGNITGWGPWSQVQCQDQTDTTPFVDINTGNGGTPGPGTGTPQDPTATQPAGSCPVPPLTVMTSAQAMSMETGQSVVFTNDSDGVRLQQCANKFISLVGNGARINSAYRPQEYQTHLFEIKDRWCSKMLRSNTNPACSSLKTAIGGEVAKHFGSNWACGAVGRTSRHTSSGAVDIGGIPDHSNSSVQAKANQSCLIWKNYPGDAVHYDLKDNCTCN